MSKMKNDSFSEWDLAKSPLVHTAFGGLVGMYGSLLQAMLKQVVHMNTSGPTASELMSLFWINTEGHTHRFPWSGPPAKDMQISTGCAFSWGVLVDVNGSCYHVSPWWCLGSFYFLLKLWSMLMSVAGGEVMWTSLVCAAFEGSDDVCGQCSGRGLCWCPSSVLPLETIMRSGARTGDHVDVCGPWLLPETCVMRSK